MMHRALSHAPARLAPMLFPAASLLACTDRPPLPPTDWFNADVNKEQRQAVVGVLSSTTAQRYAALYPGHRAPCAACDSTRCSPSYPPPYIVFGPPGTGKTITVLEAALQACRRGHTVLLVAPSDAAADILARGLAPYFTPLRAPAGEGASAGGPLPHAAHPRSLGHLLRLNGTTRKAASVFPEVLPFCAQLASGLFAIPTWEVLQRHRAIVCTCAAAGLLVSAGAKLGHFNFVMCDEAAQALEPELLVPLSLAGVRIAAP